MVGTEVSGISKDREIIKTHSAEVSSWRGFARSNRKSSTSILGSEQIP